MYCERYKKDVEEARKVVEELGFQPIQVSENTITFRLKRKGNNQLLPFNLAP